MARKINWNGVVHLLTHMFVFALIFSLIGYYVPRAYFSLAPDSAILELKELHAPDIKFNQSVQMVEIHRISHYNLMSQTVTELMLINLDNNITFVRKSFGNAFIEKGDYEFLIPFTVFENTPIPKGRYYWDVGIILTAPYNTEREMSIQSNVFEVK